MKYVAGVDEVGRGSLAGPVVAAATILIKNHPIIGLSDSKKLTKKKREELFPCILEHSIGIGIGMVSPKIIDQINIRQATFLAMERALKNLPIQPVKALIDGEALNNQNIPNEGIIKGDDKIDSIRAASIIAKVTRDRIMENYSRIFPEYGFERHSGYGTKIHMDALKNYKATPIHRRTFSPVNRNMPTISWISNNEKHSWMGEKLAGLYMYDKGYEIIKINHKNNSNEYFNIIAKKMNIHIFTIVNTLKNINENNNLTNEERLKAIKYAVNFKRSMFEDFNDYRIDLLYVRLNKNKPPNIKHLKGIDHQ